MTIESYSFGRMVVDGEEYGDDLMICGNEINPEWIRQSGHKLYPDDLRWLVDREPDLLIVGTGQSGRMTVTQEAKAYLDENGVNLWIGETDEAADYFNIKNEEEGEQIAGAFHLTC